MSTALANFPETAPPDAVLAPAAAPHSSSHSASDASGSAPDGSTASTPTETPRLAANRRNALRSTGPRTLAGKARSALNSFRHGLTGQTIAFTHDEAPHYFSLALGYIVDLRPQGVHELQIVQKIVDTMWRLNAASALDMNARRIAAIEHLDGESDSQPSPLDCALAQFEAFRADCEGPNLLEKLNRYESRLQRDLAQYHRMFYELRRHREENGPFTAASNDRAYQVACGWYSHVLEEAERRNDERLGLIRNEDQPEPQTTPPASRPEAPENRAPEPEMGSFRSEAAPPMLYRDGFRPVPAAQPALSPSEHGKLAREFWKKRK